MNNKYITIMGVGVILVLMRLKKLMLNVIKQYLIIMNSDLSLLMNVNISQLHLMNKDIFLQIPNI